MGYSARLFPDSDGLSDLDTARLAEIGLVPALDAGAPLVGFAWRDGERIAFTLDTAVTGLDRDAANAERVLPEQLIITAIIIGSFLLPLYHLVG